MTLIEILKQTRKLIVKGWTQHAGARDKNGKVVGSDSADATCWCLTGAAYATSGERYNEIIDVLNETLGFCHIDYNDTKGRTQQDILNLIDRAVAVYYND